MTNKTRIMLADDHTVLREGMRRILEQEKDFVVVGEANDGEEAVKMGKDLKPDVAILDIVMPKLNGIEATKQIRQVSPSTAVLILSAHSDMRYIIGLLEAGACGYLLKNARSSEIVKATRAVRSGESVLDPVITRKLLQRVVEPVEEQPANYSHSKLTSREIEILNLAAGGMSNQEIASALKLSLRTVKAHLTNIFNKMNCGSRTDAIVRGLKEGYISIDELPEKKAA